jgi:hypothetical protein
MRRRNIQMTDSRMDPSPQWRHGKGGRSKTKRMVLNFGLPNLTYSPENRNNAVRNSLHQLWWELTLLLLWEGLFDCALDWFWWGSSKLPGSSSLLICGMRTGPPSFFSFDAFVNIIVNPSPALGSFASQAPNLGNAPPLAGCPCTII